MGFSAARARLPGILKAVGLLLFSRFSLALEWVRNASVESLGTLAIRTHVDVEFAVQACMNDALQGEEKLVAGIDVAWGRSSVVSRVGVGKGHARMLEESERRSDKKEMGSDAGGEVGCNDVQGGRFSETFVDAEGLYAGEVLQLGADHVVN